MLREFFAPDGLTRAFFTSGGSDSVETALRLARQYHKVRGEPGRIKYLSLKKGYHGTHFGGASVNGNANFRTPVRAAAAGLLPHPGALHLSQPVQRDRSGQAGAALRLRAGRRDRLPGRRHHRRFIMEPVLGAGGVIPPHESFMPMVREICDRHGILLIADEVITAFGRTGALVGLAPLGGAAGHDVDRQGDHQRLLPLRRGDDQRTRSRKPSKATPRAAAPSATATPIPAIRSARRRPSPA
jgi:adenosylmethionine-8-amino-7-oxononanoate aminotransferase